MTDKQHFQAADSEEAKKLREQARDFESDRWLLAAEKLGDQSFGYRSSAIANSVDYGKTCIRLGVILNGGAILSLFALIGSLIGKGDQTTILVAISFGHALFWSFISFAAGLITIAMTAAIAYMNWMFMAQSYMSEGEIFNFIHLRPVEDSTNGVIIRINLTMYAALVLGFASMGCFITGSYLVADSFSVLGIMP